MPTGSSSEGINYVSEVRVFPNPAKDILNAQFDDVVAKGLFHLVDVLGRVLYSRNIAKENAISIDLNDLHVTENMIFAVIKVEGEETKLEKIILLR